MELNLSGKSAGIMTNPNLQQKDLKSWFDKKTERHKKNLPTPNFSLQNFTFKCFLLYFQVVKISQKKIIFKLL